MHGAMRCVALLKFIVCFFLLSFSFHKKKNLLLLRNVVCCLLLVVVANAIDELSGEYNMYFKFLFVIII
jgi:hypothetical protein